VIHHVQLACPPGGESALREFYGSVLGLDEIPKPPALAARGGCWFGGHGIELHLGVEEDFRPARKAHPGLLVTGLDAWARRLRDAGYPVQFDDGFPGMRRFYSQDAEREPARVPRAHPRPAFRPRPAAALIWSVRAPLHVSGGRPARDRRYAGSLALWQGVRGVWLLPVEPELERGWVWAWPRMFSGGSPMVSW